MRGTTAVWKMGTTQFEFRRHGNPAGALMPLKGSKLALGLGMPDRIEFLKERATEFRNLANTRGGRNGIKQQLIELAERCEQIAAGIEHELQQRGDA